MKKQVKTEKKIGRQSWRKRQEKKESTESGLGKTLNLINKLIKLIKINFWKSVI